MLVLGLTGSIGAGKSTVAAMFAAAGIAVHDADRVVHDLYRAKAAPMVEEAFPGTVRDGVVDRGALAGRVGDDAEALRSLEKIVHPLVRAEEQRFRAAAAAKGQRIAVLDIPLLLETGGASRVDAVAVVTAPERTRLARVMTRAGMTEARFFRLAARQLPESDKRHAAHFLIDNSGSISAAEGQVADVIRALAAAAAAK